MREETETHKLMSAVNTQELRSQAAVAAAAATRLQGYRGYLAGVRARKAANAFPARFELDVVAQARGAAADARVVASAAIETLRQLRNAGMLDGFVASLAAANGPIDARGPGEQVLGDADVMQRLRAAGFSAVTLAGARAVLGRLELPIATIPGGLRIADVDVATPAALAPPTTLAGVLAADTLDLVAEHLAGSGPFAVAALDRPANAGKVPLESAVAAGLCAGVLDVVRHARKLEDAGLAVYEGHDPGTLIFLAIVGGMLIVAGGIILIECAEDKSTPESTCKAGWTLITLGLALLFKGIGGKDVSVDVTGGNGNAVTLQSTSNATLPPT